MNSVCLVVVIVFGILALGCLEFWDAGPILPVKGEGQKWFWLALLCILIQFAALAFPILRELNLV